jgi:hypothetical protein
MSFVLRTPNGDVDLGPSMEVLRAFGEIGKLEPGDELGALHYVPQTNEEELPAEYVGQLVGEAQACLERHRDELTEPTVGVLQALAAMRPRSVW